MSGSSGGSSFYFVAGNRSASAILSSALVVLYCILHSFPSCFFSTPLRKSLYLIVRHGEVLLEMNFRYLLAVPSVPGTTRVRAFAETWLNVKQMPLLFKVLWVRALRKGGTCEK